uniref:valine--tRNA ligase n=1 Tax=Chromera velia CCMP2878 TaxID=1169474 RepID=A0A0G4HWS9_9ALVE|eukprot:Cvel_9091.t1-p1 / transcript=Cvel_9091.t1 / gene=Cvel_9091 / organism=Chromera_velia_CCMP2878 / gene_product=Valine--tRNA ligase, putative / transcript_product=Valine--tRNA ligase, putative / location=Cvel_scaffold516:15825-24958(-) / protein_length=713 / sequence_SO=supercontig / SO=protein_coding / is_pseudo=false
MGGMYKHLIGKRVVVPMSEGNRGIPVIGDDYVDREFGTGALKVTPGHDPNDWKLGQKHSLEVMNVMNKDGTMNENAGRYASMDRFECRKKIWNDMETAGLTIKTEEIDQRVPRSQRGGEVIEPLVSEQWFLKTGNMGRRGLEAVEEGKLKILPQRFEKVWNNWLSDLRDWCISRQLWWGHQIPVWYLEDPQSEEERRASFCARSEDEALEEARKATGRSDLRLRRDPDVLDTWFSSGLWPFATVGWPDEGAEDFAKFYPASVLETGYDILFFWVARMVMMGLELTDRVPFHTIFLHGLVRDGEGQKMSKTKGNVIDPLEVAGSFGADALRFSLVIGGTPGQDVPLAMDKVKGNRNFANKIWNVGRFVASQFEGISEEERGKVAEEKEKLAEEGADFGSLPLADRFILSKCHGAIEEVSASLGTLDVSSAGKRVYEFFWDEFSEWYIGSASTRLQGQEGPEKRDAARKVLLYGCERALRLVHPFMPFVSEAVWQRLPRRGGTNSNKDEAPSLMIAEWPDREDGSGRSLLWRDLEAEAQFGALQRTVEAIRSARAEYGLELSKKITKAKVEVAAGEPSLLQTLQAEKNTLSLFARLDNESTEITSADGGGGEGGQSGGASVRLVVDERIQVVLPLAELVDVHKERARLTKQMTLAQKSADALQKRINNPKFVQNANPRVVESTRKEFEELQAQIEKLKESLEQVETLAATTAATS